MDTSTINYLSIGLFLLGKTLAMSFHQLPLELFAAFLNRRKKDLSFCVSNQEAQELMWNELLARNTGDTSASSPVTTLTSAMLHLCCFSVWFWANTNQVSILSLSILQQDMNQLGQLTSKPEANMSYLMTQKQQSRVVAWLWRKTSTYLALSDLFPLGQTSSLQKPH